MAPTDYRIASFNVYGLNNGLSLLQALCGNHNIDLIAVQEHWLTPNNIDQLNHIHPDLVGFSLSAMCKN
jgi:exonuclease III